MNKIACEFCNKEFDTQAQLRGHQIACRKKHQEAEQEQEQEVVSIPLSACPPELSYLQENRQMFLRVAGRKIGDRFIVEGTKVVR
jgi:hypothetical protein